MKALLSLFLLGFALPALAQTQVPKRTAVKFLCTCSDTTGQAFATAFRDLLATSPRYSETFEVSEKLANGKESPNWQIEAVSLDPSSNYNGVNAVLSTVFLLGDRYYLTQTVQTCPRSRVAACAANTLATLDKYLNSPSH